MENWMPLASGAMAFGAMLGLTPLAIRLAHRHGWLAYPQADRWHARPTALGGGVAIYGAATLAYLLFGMSAFPWPIWAGATLMFVTGLVDDRVGISPASKFVAQLMATGVLLAAGYAFGPQWPYWLSFPVTFMWVVGVTNALNLLDNMDGLAAGIAALAAGVYAVFAAAMGVSAAGPLAVAGAAAGFVVFNFKPARIFMGDSGSLFLGFMLAALGLFIQAQAPPAEALAAVLASVAVLAVLLFDTMLVTVARVAAGRPISQGGRDHSSHRLVRLGLSERRAVLSLYGLGVLVGGLALAFLYLRPGLVSAFLLVLVVGLAVLGRYLGGVAVYPPPASPRPARTRLKTLLALPDTYWGPSWKAIFGVGADLLLVSAAFIMAYYLRFEDGITPQHEATIIRALPLVIIVKLPIFFRFKLYRALWRHAGIPELVRIVKANAVASVVVFVALALLFGFNKVARGVIVIDWMISLITIAGVRLSFRGLRQYLSAPAVGRKRVLLYGAGDAGLIGLRELRQNQRLGLEPIGFLDDDPAKRDQMMQDLYVLGPFADLAALCRRHRIDEVLITTAVLTNARRAAILAACAEAGVGCRRLEVRMDRLAAEAPADVVAVRPLG